MRNKTTLQQLCRAIKINKLQKFISLCTFCFIRVCVCVFFCLLFFRLNSRRTRTFRVSFLFRENCKSTSDLVSVENLSDWAVQHSIRLKRIYGFEYSTSERVGILEFHLYVCDFGSRLYYNTCAQVVRMLACVCVEKHVCECGCIASDSHQIALALL